MYSRSFGRNFLQELGRWILLDLIDFFRLFICAHLKDAREIVAHAVHGVLLLLLLIRIKL
jgi:hypothetical protein